jgi:hypothetical protein
MRAVLSAGGLSAAATFLAAPVSTAAQIRPDSPAPRAAFVQFGAQAPRRPPVPQVPPRRGTGYRIYFVADVTQMIAVDTFSAVAGSPRLLSFGGGGEVLRVWQGLFLRGALTRAMRTGERVVVFDDEVVGVGIPIDIALTPIEVAAGWRAETGRTRAVGAYAGGGLLRLRYQETSEFAAPGQNVDRSFNGYFFLSGLDFTVGKAFVIGVEAQYRTVPDAIGTAGASEAFRETDLGGITARVMIGFRN